jgi:hypothetical protein
MSDKSRFLNFPIVMLAETIADPKRGLNAIACFAFEGYAKHCERDFESAFAQMAYLARSQNAVLPKAVRAFLARRDVAELAEEIDEEAWGAGDYPAGAADMARDCLPEGAITDRERKAVVSFVALRDAAHFFGRKITDYDAVMQSAARSRQAVSEHETRHGKDATASVPADYFFEVLDSQPTLDDMRILRVVAAVRSLVGAKTVCGSTKAMIAARMIGAKSPVVAADMAAKSPAIAAELAALSSRKRFDRISTTAAARGFFGKCGMGRRVYLSVERKDPVALAACVKTRFDRLTEYKERERTARAARNPQLY